MPAKSPEAIARKKAKAAERKRNLRANDEIYQERERQRLQKREQGRTRTRSKRRIIPPEEDDWEIFQWENGFVQRRGGNESYRPLLEELHEADLKKNVKRLNVWETTPLSVKLRESIPRVWQTQRSATLQIPGAPLIKRFKVMDPKDQNPIPIGEGELVRKFFSHYRSKKGYVFPKSHYDNVLDAPIFFMPEAFPDLMEWDCEYVDISRCYSQLLGRLPSLAIRFHYLGKRFEPVEYLPPYPSEILESKHFGRAAVGMMRQKMGRCFIYGEPKRFPSRFFAPDTANWIHGILHCLASYAVNECGCFRWHTDGGFFPEGGGKKFSRLLNSLGLLHTLEEYAAVIFASLDQYEAVLPDGSVKQTRMFLSTFISDYIFLPAEQGGSQRNSIVNGLDSSFFYKTLEREHA